MRAERESDIQRTCFQFLELNGAVVVRVNSGGMKVAATPTAKERFVKFNSGKGTSDLIACIEGKFVACEVKSADGTLRPDQRAFLDRVTKAGGLGLVVRSLTELRAALAAEGYEWAS